MSLVLGTDTQAHPDVAALSLRLLPQSLCASWAPPRISSPPLPSLLLPPWQSNDSSPRVGARCSHCLWPSHLDPDSGDTGAHPFRNKKDHRNSVPGSSRPMARVIVKGFLGLASVPHLFVRQTFIKYQLGVRSCLWAQPAWLCVTSSA